MLAGAAGLVTTMPQIDLAADRDAGLHVPGVYEALLEHERAKYEGRGEVAEFDGRQHRVSWLDPDDHDRGFFLWSRHRLDQLEAGESLRVSAGTVELALWDRDRERDSSAPRPRLPFGREARQVLVSSDDSVLSACR